MVEGNDEMVSILVTTMECWSSGLFELEGVACRLSVSMVKTARRSMEDEEEGDDVLPQILYVEGETTRRRLVICERWMGRGGGCAARRLGGGGQGCHGREAWRMNVVVIYVVVYHLY